LYYIIILFYLQLLLNSTIGISAKFFRFKSKQFNFKPRKKKCNQKSCIFYFLFSIFYFLTYILYFKIKRGFSFRVPEIEKFADELKQAKSQTPFRSPRPLSIPEFEDEKINDINRHDHLQKEVVLNDNIFDESGFVETPHNINQK